jgi:hypothetical protein
VGVLDHPSAWHSPFFDRDTFLDHIVVPPRSMRFVRRAPEVSLTWAWALARSIAHRGDSEGYLICRPERWPTIHLTYGIAASPLGSRYPHIKAWTDSLLAALDWD